MAGDLMLTYAVVSQLFFGWAAYFIAVVSPGPAVLAIITTSMNSGRKAGLVFAAGVLTGSFFWGVLAAVGLSAVMAIYADFVFYLKICGGLYLLYLSSKAFRSAWNSDSIGSVIHSDQNLRMRRLYLRGLGLHLTNPKAIFAWMALVSLGLPHGSSPILTGVFVAGCMVIGMITFCGFALVFSIPTVLAVYQKMRRLIETSLGVFFAFAGWKMLTTKI